MDLRSASVHIIFVWWRTGPYTAIWPSVPWTICYIFDCTLTSGYGISVTFWEKQITSIDYNRQLDNNVNKDRDILKLATNDSNISRYLNQIMQNQVIQITLTKIKINLSRLTQIKLNQIRLNQIKINLSRLTQTMLNQIRLNQIGINLSRLTQTMLNQIRLNQIEINLSRLT
jgi:post-segregation antitoxin (ccd killing protein)